MRLILCTILAAALLVPPAATSQERMPADTSIIFQPATPELVQTTQYEPRRTAWGLDLLVSNNGFGAGFFYRSELSDELAALVSLAISDVKDDAEVEYVDYFGQTFVPGKKNRLLLIPLMGGVQYRLFKDDIMDNFRPFVMAGAGPAMIYVAPYANPVTVSLADGVSYTEYNQVDFFSSLGKGRPRYTFGGFVGAGAYFGLDRGTLTGISMRYYYVPFPKGIEILDHVPVKQFGGFYITINFGFI
jgi:hypothetical protein